MLSSHRTFDPEEADFFYVPVGVCFTQSQLVKCLQLFPSLLQGLHHLPHVACARMGRFPILLRPNVSRISLSVVACRGVSYFPVL